MKKKRKKVIIIIIIHHNKKTEKEIVFKVKNSNVTNSKNANIQIVIKGMDTRGGRGVIHKNKHKINVF